MPRPGHGMGGRIGGVERRGAPYGAVVALAVETAQEEQALPKDLVLRTWLEKRGWLLSRGKTTKTFALVPHFNLLLGKSLAHRLETKSPLAGTPINCHVFWEEM